MTCDHSVACNRVRITYGNQRMTSEKLHLLMTITANMRYRISSEDVETAGDIVIFGVFG